MEKFGPGPNFRTRYRSPSRICFALARCCSTVGRAFDAHSDTAISAPAFAPLSPAWRVDLRLENLGDREYALVDGYATAGRSGLFSLHWEGN